MLNPTPEQIGKAVSDLYGATEENFTPEQLNVGAASSGERVAVAGPMGGAAPEQIAAELMAEADREADAAFAKKFGPSAATANVALCECGRDRCSDHWDSPCDGCGRPHPRLDVNGVMAAMAKGESFALDHKLMDEARKRGLLPPLSSPDIGPGGSLPISDLAQRLKLLADAWVETYEDGPLRIRFDIEGRRAHVQNTQGTPGNDTPQW